LIDKDDVPRPLISVLFNALVNEGYDIMVWSGGGLEYAKLQARKINCIDRYICHYDAKFNFQRFNINEHDFCIDDEEFVCKYFVEKGGTAFLVPFYNSKLDSMKSHGIFYDIFKMVSNKITGFIRLK